MWEREAAAVVEAITRDFPIDKDHGRVMWISGQSSAARVIDCVLSLNRNYAKVVVPRVQAFITRFPKTKSCVELAAMIVSCSSTQQFSKEMLRYNSPAFGDRLLAVPRYLIKYQQASAASAEERCLRCWATSSKPQDYLGLGIDGFGLAGFQYLRVLFGADTSKPDIYIIRYISKAVGRNVSAMNALMILERAGLMASRSVRRLDYLIWNAGAASKPERAPRCCGGAASTAVLRGALA